MSDIINVKMDKAILNKLIAQLSKKSFIELGVFDSTRSDDKSNLEIAARHELGIGVPQRSFILLPLLFKKELIMTFFNSTEKHFKYIIDKGIDEWINLVMISCLKIIQGGFATGGYGQWRALSPMTIKKKGSATILVETGELLRAIKGMVFKKSN